MIRKMFKFDFTNYTESHVYTAYTITKSHWGYNVVEIKIYFHSIVKFSQLR